MCKHICFYNLSLCKITHVIFIVFRGIRECKFKFAFAAHKRLLFNKIKLYTQFILYTPDVSGPNAWPPHPPVPNGTFGREKKLNLLGLFKILVFEENPARFFSRVLL